MFQTGREVCKSSLFMLLAIALYEVKLDNTCETMTSFEFLLEPVITCTPEIIIGHP